MMNNNSAAGYGKKRNRPHDEEEEDGEEDGEDDDGEYDGRVGQRPLKKKQRF